MPVSINGIIILLNICFILFELYYLTGYYIYAQYNSSVKCDTS